MLIQRLTSAIVLVPIVLWLSYWGGPWFAGVVAVAALMAGYEFFRMMRRSGYQPSYVAGLALIGLLLFDAYRPGCNACRWGLALAVALPMVWQVLQNDPRSFLLNWALMLAGAFYVGGLSSHLISLRNLPQGLNWLLLTFAATWTCDSTAYAVGTRWGKRPFFAHISPKKTWEGAIAGLVAGVAATVIAGLAMGLVLWQGVALGSLLVLGATFGDLAESLLKRQIGVKDSSSLIPGHGGMLDRIDSLLFAGVITYYFVLWVIL